MVMTMHSTDFIWGPNAPLIQWLTSRGFRPNLLVTGRDVEIEAITKPLMAWCARPFHVCALPGALRLPGGSKGTLFLEGVAELTLRQQIDLNDWISAGRGDVQIVSITSVPLWPLVEDGRFLEGLFFRLNVVCLEAKSTADGHSTSPEDPDIFDLDAIDIGSFTHPLTGRRWPRNES
jgi:hypothetical protein